MIKTWVLVIATIHGNGLATIPGYESFDACLYAAAHVERVLVISSPDTEDRPAVVAICTHGPRRRR